MADLICLSDDSDDPDMLMKELQESISKVGGTNAATPDAVMMCHGPQRVVKRTRQSLLGDMLGLTNSTNKQCNLSMAKCSAANSDRQNMVADTVASACTTQEMPAKRSCQSPLFPLRRLWSDPVTVCDGSGKDRLVPDGDLPTIAPVAVIRKALPTELADRLLLGLLHESEASWRASSWMVHGKSHKTPRTSAEYWLQQATPSPSGIDDHTHQRCEPSRDLHEAAHRIRELVAGMRPKACWNPSYALANRYSDGQDCVGWHSDFLNALGPRPIIVGLSLGASRLFRVRSDSGKPQVTVTVPMPHNTLIVMWGDCQESWQHSVPRLADNSIGRHPRAGLARISLTFRMARPELHSFCERCHCGRPSVLKSKAGRYYSSCRPIGAEVQCRFWQNCAWAQTEAERLRREVEPGPSDLVDPVLLE